MLPELADSEYFSLLDAMSGYWHVPLQKESILLYTWHKICAIKSVELLGSSTTSTASLHLNCNV